MSMTIEYVCELVNGVHARPASHIEAICNSFKADIVWHNQRTNRKGNAKSALAIIGTDTVTGDTCSLLISGIDEAEAHQRLSYWLNNEFKHCDTPLERRVHPFKIRYRNL